MRSVQLGTHAHNAMLGVTSAGDGRCVSTVAKDGVVTYDVEEEVKERSRNRREIYDNI